MTTRQIPARAVLLLPAGLALLAGLDAALLLLGLPAPVTTGYIADAHGYLMTLGFVGALIALERAVALGTWWGYLSPAALGIGGLLLMTPVPRTLALGLSFVGIAAMCINYIPLWRRNRDEAVLIQMLGSVLAVVATILLVAGLPIRVLVPWLAGFLILTICGERLELARLALAPRDGDILLTMSVSIALSLMVSLMWPMAGYPLLGAVLIVMTAWLASRDVARKLITTTGSRRFMAACMLAGYAWLAVAGSVWLFGPAFEGTRYDAVIHATFLGFTMSMIMAHATTILPAVLRRPLPYRTFMWVPAVLLHASLLLRVWIGDGLALPWAVTAGGLLNVIALLLFFGTAVTSSVLASRAAARQAEERKAKAARRATARKAEAAGDETARGAVDDAADNSADSTADSAAHGRTTAIDPPPNGDDAAKMAAQSSKITIPTHPTNTTR